MGDNGEDNGDSVDGGSAGNGMDEEQEDGGEMALNSSQNLVRDVSLLQILFTQLPTTTEPQRCLEELSRKVFILWCSLLVDDVDEGVMLLLMMMLAMVMIMISFVMVVLVMLMMTMLVVLIMMILLMVR